MSGRNGFMLTAVEGYYDGNQIIMNEDIDLSIGQKVIVTVLDTKDLKQTQKVDLRKYMGRGEKMFQADAQNYVEELRADDRV